MNVQNAAVLQPPRVGWGVMFAYWLLQLAHWLALLTPLVITLALRVDTLAGAGAKAGALGLIMGIGAFAAMASAPFWGWVSDRTVSRFGRRKPWIVVGHVSLIVGLIVMAQATTLLTLGIGWVVCQIGSNAALAGLNAVLADQFPEEQHGVMSGLLGTSPFAAIVLGVVMTGFTTGSPAAEFLAPALLLPFALCLFLVTVPGRAVPGAGVSAAAVAAEDLPRTRHALLHPDFAWAFVSRFLVNFAYAFAISYQVYFMTDRLQIPAARVAAFMATSASVMGGIALVLSMFGGWLSDRFHRRKPFVIGAAILLAIGLIGLSTASSFAHMLVAMALVSVGQGLYFAVDVALCVEVLPDKRTAARDLGVLQIASSLPQSLAPTVAPVLLGIGAASVAGGGNYAALFMTGATIALAGACTIVPIRGVR